MKALLGLQSEKGFWFGGDRLLRLRQLEPQLPFHASGGPCQNREL